MKPEKDKYYWIEFAEKVYPRRCIAVTESGGIFDVPCMGTAEREAHRIVAEAEPPAGDALVAELRVRFDGWLRKMILGTGILCIALVLGAWIAHLTR